MTAITHSLVFRDPAYYAGWPANYGIWGWGDEIVTGFFRGIPDPEGDFHKRARNRPVVPMQARSLDGGVTWSVVPFSGVTPGGRGFAADEHMIEELTVGAILNTQRDLLPCPGQISFDTPGFALLCGRTGLHGGAVSWFYLSADRCNSWLGPYRLPDFGMSGISARTDYVVHSATACTLWLTGAKTNGREGRVFAARTDDAGRTFHFAGWLGVEPSGFQIMPATVALPGGDLLTAVRCQAQGRAWLELYRVASGSSEWRLIGRPVEANGGNPPSMIRLHDGRVCLVYGYRLPPFGIRARLSTDEGQTWGDEVILRVDGGDGDLGYPRSFQRSDGQIVTVYYYNDAAQGERYIGCTRWSA